VVFYDDGMAVGNDYNLLKKQGLQIQCDLLRAGLVPGVTKCIWEPVSVVQWNGLKGSRQPESRGIWNMSNCPNLARTAVIEVRFSLNFAIVFDFTYFRFHPSKAK
jgi:hypothetical protein